MAADAQPTESPPAAPPSAPSTSLMAAPSAEASPYHERETLVLQALKKIYDPEIPMNIVDLGLVYAFDWSGDELTLKMTLTSPGCPVAGILAEEIKAAVEKVPKIARATVDMVWEPAWSPDRMSVFAKRQFGYL